jgi:uncharacterized protein with gpF-like domain
MRDLKDLHLSQRDGSISKTLKEDLKKIIADGVQEGLSYSSIAKQIRETDPFIFSKSRAELIAVNEVGRAYGFGTHEPSRVLVEDEGYIMEKKWVSSNDDRVRKTHAENAQAGWIPFGSLFPGTGDEYAPSQKDIRCRCTSTSRIIGQK